jgi:hypothetical protein
MDLPQQENCSFVFDNFKKIDYICNKYELEGANMEETTKMY